MEATTWEGEEGDVGEEEAVGEAPVAVVAMAVGEEGEEALEEAAPAAAAAGGRRDLQWNHSLKSIRTRNSCIYDRQSSHRERGVGL